jgi:KDO2-lipid IV(A) lauroyltransferase
MSKLTNKLQLWLLAKVAKLSWKNSYRLSDFLSWLLFRVFSYRKEVIRTNLRNSFVSKSEAELLQIERSFYHNFTDLVIETIKLQNISREELSSKIYGDISLVERLYAEGKSAVFVLGHRGNWEIANLFVSSNFSHDCIIVYKPLSNKPMDDWFCQIRTQFGSEVVSIPNSRSLEKNPTSYFL